MHEYNNHGLADSNAELPATSRALVVDDSKSARVILGKLLKKHGVISDMAESAEDALIYLRTQRPDVIFMDHMMPGMDGFAAVKLIKENPDTATIPIVMYTSKGGEVYVGQARALGAVDVLPKQVHPVELRKILRRLHLLDDPETISARLEADSAWQPVVAGQAERRAPFEPDYTIAPQSFRGMLRGVLDESQAQLKQDVAEAVQRGLRAGGHGEPGWSGEAMSAELQAGFTKLNQQLTRFRYSFYLLIVIMAGAWLATWDQEKGDLSRTVEEQQAILEKKELEYTRLWDENKKLVQHLKQSKVRHDTDSNTVTHLLNTIAWAANTRGEYGFDEVALDDNRMQMLRELVTRLAEVNFKGAIQMDVHMGKFCLLQDDSGAWKVAPDTLPIARCAAFGLPEEEAVELGQRQSLGFANFLASSPVLKRDQVTVEVRSHGVSEPLIDYPDAYSVQTAGEWNQIAQRNQRVAVSLVQR